MMALKRRFLVRFTISVVSACLVLAAAGPVRAQTVVPPLTGELLSAVDSQIPGASFGSLAITHNCPASGPGTISYTASGPALGPFYPGTYTETGTFTLGAQGALLGHFPVVSFEATFTIDSEEGALNPFHIEGTKQLAPPGPQVRCGQVGAFRDISALGVQATYTAEITTATGTCTTGGSSLNNLLAIAVLFEEQILEHASFQEDFSTGTPCLVVASDRDECRDGGWETAVREDGTGFKNQGDCMLYVNTGK